MPNALDMSKERIAPKGPTCVAAGSRLHKRLRANCSGPTPCTTSPFGSMHDRLECNVLEARSQEKRAESSLILLQSQHSPFAKHLVHTH